MPTNIAIIDLGSARTKLFVGHLTETGEVTPVIVAKSETNLMHKIQPNGEISVEDISIFIGAVRELLESAKAEGVSSVILLATESLRKTSSQAMIIDRLHDELGLETNILSPVLEADILFAGVQATSNRQIVVADIGGGSVQLVWGSGKSISMPTGTLTLQKKFQVPEQLPTAETYTAMRAYLSSELETALRGRTVTVPSLTVGSTCMRNFFDSAMRVAGIVTQPKETYSAQDIDRLFELVAGKPYESLGEYYPADLFFMYGVDKLLLTLQVLMPKLNSSSITPTNESISTSLVRLASEEGDLGRIGIKASPVSA